MLTKKQIKKYLKAGKNVCLFCESENVERSKGYSMHGDNLSLPYVCKDCGEKWDDIYTLSDVEY
jgi:transposase-like protein